MFKPDVSKLQAKRKVKKLITALKYEKKKDISLAVKIRSAAAVALGKIGDTRAVEPLSEALINSINLEIRDTYFSSRFSREAAWALGQLKDARSTDSLILALKSESTRKEAAEALGVIGDPRAVKPLVSVINDKKLDVRKAATKALVGVGTKEALKTVIRLLMDDQKEIRCIAKSELERVAWVPESDTDRAYYLRASEQWEELSTLGTQAAELLVHCLSEVSRVEKIFVRNGPINSIIKLGNLATEALINALYDKNCARAGNAAYALGEIGDEKAVEPLIKAVSYRRENEVLAAAAREVLGYGEVEFQVEAVEALNKIRPKVAKTVFIERISGDWLYREAKVHAIWILEEIGDDQIVESLIKTLKIELKKRHPNPDIKKAATNALVSIGSLKAVDVLLESFFPEGKEDLEYLENHVGVDPTKDLKLLMGDYATFVQEIIDPLKDLKGWIIGGIPTGRTEANLSFFDEVIQDLCKIETSISTNILHKISKLSDFRVGQLSMTSGILSLESQRRMAIKELKKRGNPPYDPSIFLDKNAWKLNP